MQPLHLSSRAHRRHRLHSFTLVELLVAVAIMLILLLVIFSAFGTVAVFYQHTVSRADTFRDGRAALQLLSSELDTMVDPSSFLTNGATNGPGLLPQIEIGPPTTPYLGFMARVPQKAQLTSDVSDVCIVGYFLAANTNNPSGCQSLYRVLVDSTDTYTRLANGDTNLLQTTDMTPQTTNAEPVADNVIKFSVQGLDQEMNPLTDTTSTNLTYVQVYLQVIGARDAQAYFQTNAPVALKTRIENEDARDFTFRSRIRSNPN